MKFTRTAFLLLLLLFSSYLNAQVLEETKAKVDNINFELVNNQVIIHYDLVKTNKDERFDLNVTIFKSNSNTKIEATAFSGDLYNQPPGEAKEIVWDLAKDISYLDDNIFISIEATHLNPKTIAYTSKKVALLQSTVFPGWGTSKISLNKFNLMKGIAAYSLIYMSVKSNKDAAAYYKEYIAATESESRDYFFSKAEKSYQNSFYYCGGAVTIWLMEYLWIGLAANKTDAQKISQKKISFRYNYIPQEKMPVLTILYKF